MQEMLAPEEGPDPTRAAEVAPAFKALTAGTIAVTGHRGKITRGAANGAVVRRGGPSSTDTKIESLRRFNDDVEGMTSGFECGIVLTHSGRQRRAIVEAYETPSKEGGRARGDGTSAGRTRGSARNWIDRGHRDRMRGSTRRFASHRARVADERRTRRGRCLTVTRCETSPRPMRQARVYVSDA